MGLEKLERDGASHWTRPQTSEGLNTRGGHRAQDQARAHGAGELAESLGRAMGRDLAAEVRHLDLDQSAPGALGLDTVRSLHGALPSSNSNASHSWS
jgi:hypothetical protein